MGALRQSLCGVPAARLLRSFPIDVTISVVATSNATFHGDGCTDVGWISAAGIDLGRVTINGDLGKIDCGNGTSHTDALKSLNVQSLGRFGTATGAPDVFTNTTVVKGDVQQAIIKAIDKGGGTGSVGSLFIGGSLIGGAAMNWP